MTISLCQAIAFAQNSSSGSSGLSDEITEMKESDFRQWMEKQPENDLRFELQKLSSKGSAELDNAKFPQAENYLTRAQLIAEKIDDKILVAKSLHQLGKVSRAKGEAAKAREFYEQAEKLLRASSESEAKLPLGFLLTDFSNLLILERQTGKGLQTAFEAWQIAKIVSDAQLPATAANAIGAAFRQQGNVVSAVAWLEESRQIAVKSEKPDYFLLGDTALRLGYLYEAQGEYNLALNNLRQAEKAFTQLNQPQQNLRLWKALADIYNGHGQTGEAIRYLQQTCKLAEELNLTRRAITCQTDLGLTYLWQKDFDRAGKFLEKAENGASQIKAEDLQLKILVGRASLLGQTGQFKQSLDTFARAENLARQKGEWTDELRINWLKTTVLIEQKNFPESLIAAEKAVSLAESHQDTDSLAFLLALRSKILLKLKQRKKARETFSQAITLIEQGRGQMNEAASSVGFLGERSESYRNLIELELEENRRTEALIVSDMLKSRWLTDRSTAATRAAPNAESWQMSDEAKNLRRKVLNVSEKVLANAGEADQELAALEKTYQEKIKPPDSLNERFNLPKAGLTEKQLTSLVTDSKTAIVSFAVTATNKVVAFVVRKDRVSAVPLAADYSALARKIRALRQEIVTFVPNYKQSAKNLYQDLLFPIESEISAAEKLIIVPDLGLWELPFQALIAGDGQFLAKKYQISYVPSLRFYQSSQQSKTDSNQTFLAFGNSITDAAKPLKEAEREVMNVSKLYSRPAVFVGPAATETRFKQEAAKSNFIHLAVHGKINADDPFDSALLLTKDAGEDGKLTVSEILQMPRLPQSLVVLSGCDTSNGQVLSGEGILSLSWAFLAAGGRTVVAAQWAVEERTTADLMENFHRVVSQDGKKSADALQAAQRQAMKRPSPFNHPFYWAGFVVIGD